MNSRPCVRAKLTACLRFVGNQHSGAITSSTLCPYPFFPFPEKNTTFLGHQHCLQLSLCPGLALNFKDSSCLVALKERCHSIPSASSIPLPFLTWLLQHSLFLHPALISFIYNTANTLLSQLRTLGLSSLFMCHSIFVHPLSILFFLPHMTKTSCFCWEVIVVSFLTSR